MTAARQLNNLEVSMFTLWSLFVLTDQHFMALYRYSDILDENYELKTDDEIYLSTIREALVYQIFLKTCSFIEEWDQVLGVKTEPEFDSDVRKVKKVAKHHRKFLNSWKGLREFRNQAIAHNHRDKKGQNIYYTGAKFHAPYSISELTLMIYCLEKMAKTLGAFFWDEFQNLLPATKERIDANKLVTDSKVFTLDEIKAYLCSLEKSIETEFKSCSDVINVTSIYGDIILQIRE